jgi:gamma-glutamylcyclotransferase (GGCT)/AIG2-like uncharacterized protein YtfP
LPRAAGLHIFVGPPVFITSREQRSMLKRMVGRDGRSAGAPPPGTIHIFVYGTLRSGGLAAALLAGGEKVRDATVQGTLYDIGGRYPALVLAGAGTVYGELWRCDAELLAGLDEYEGVHHGLFRRVALEVAGVPAWTYVAGSALATELTRARRIEAGGWPAQEPA